MSSLSPEHRSLLMRANRLLGASLVEANLVKIENLEAANERLLELISTGNYRKGSVLSILAYELQVVKEGDVLQYAVDEQGAGLVDLRSYDIPEDLRATTDLGACWATWSTRNIGLPGGPRSMRSSLASAAAGYQTVTRTVSRCWASRSAAVGLVVSRWRSPTVAAAAAPVRATAASARASMLKIRAMRSSRA